jgi:hypothetical protein
MNEKAIINNQLWMAFEEERQIVWSELKKKNLETSLTAIKNYDNFVYHIRLDLDCYVAEISLQNELRLEFYQKIS